MPEAKLQNVSLRHFCLTRASRPLLPLVCLVVAALTAMLSSPVVHAAKHTVHDAKKQAVTSHAKRDASHAAAKAPRTHAANNAKSSRSAGKVTQAKRSPVVRAGRNVVATLSRKHGKTIVAVQRRSVVRVAESVPARLSYG